MSTTIRRLHSYIMIIVMYGTVLATVVRLVSICINVYQHCHYEYQYRCLSLSQSSSSSSSIIINCKNMIQTKNKRNNMFTLRTDRTTGRRRRRRATTIIIIIVM